LKFVTHRKNLEDDMELGVVVESKQISDILDEDKSKKPFNYWSMSIESISEGPLRRLCSIDLRSMVFEKIFI
jgi:hypothetical protein